jgi:hypothetical protein
METHGFPQARLVLSSGGRVEEPYTDFESERGPLV